VLAKKNKTAAKKKDAANKKPVKAKKKALPSASGKKKSPDKKEFYTPSCIVGMVASQVKEGMEVTADHVRDVTEREVAESALRESERRFRNTFENAAVGMSHVGLDGRFLRVNQKFCNMVGYSREELSGKTFHEITWPEDLEADLQRVDRLIKGEIESVTIEKRYIHKDGRIVWVNLTGSLQRDEELKPQHFVSIVEDISLRKKAEETLNESLKDLERSNRELEQFAYIVSHDLKEPLRMITSYVQILNKRYKGKFDTKADEFMDFIVEGTMRMDDLLDDLLEYSRVGKKGDPFQPVDLNKIVKFARDNLKRIISKSGAEIRYSKLPTVSADEVQMIQLFQNLIGNAIKFRSDESPRIDVSAETAGYNWTICIHDNGIGIDPKHLDRVFLMFRRLHGRGKYPGTGVGLSICKKIVERHGGRIWAESRAGKGSKFCFTIPAKE
jgi:PAS domain S-box-containing protein